MATHTNFVVMCPYTGGDGKEYFTLYAVRGVEASGNSGVVKLDYIGTAPDYETAVSCAKAAPVLLEGFWAYAPNPFATPAPDSPP